MSGLIDVPLICSNEKKARNEISSTFMMSDVEGRLV